MFGQGLGVAQLATPFNRVVERYLFLVVKITVKAPDTFQMTVDRLWLKPFGHQMIDIGGNLVLADLFKGDIDPQHKLSELIKIGFKRMV